MAEAQRPEWLTGLIGVVRQLCAQTDASVRNTTAKAKNVGRVSADAELGPGWFWLGLAGRSADSELLEGGYLAPAEGAEQHRFQLIESVQDGNVLKVRVAEHAPHEGLFLWLPSRGMGFLEKSLLDCLEKTDRFDLIDRFGAGRADAVPIGTGAPDALNAEQARAWTACCSPGLHLVWGPPGTGKTKVIALALQHLIALGKRVLLVSATNIAVDNALVRTAAAIKPAPGMLVRVGTPHLRDVAADPTVCLQALVRARQEALERQRLDLEERIASARANPDVVQLAEMRAELEGFDPVAYHEAEESQASETLRKEGSAELTQLNAQTLAVAKNNGDWHRFRDDVRGRHQAAAEARGHIREARLLQQRRDDSVIAWSRLETEVDRLKSEADRLDQQLTAAAGMRRRFGSRHQRILIKDCQQRLKATTGRRDELAASLADEYGRTQIEEHRMAAFPYTEEALTELDKELAQAEQDTAQADEYYAEHLRKIENLTKRLAVTQHRPPPTDTQRDLVSRARALDLLGKHAALPQLEQRVTAVERDIERMTGEYEQILTRMRREGIQVKHEIVRGARVVAATLAGLRTSPELADSEFDYVMVDEVAAACPPEVVYAASRATTGVTLLGDFLQNGPIAPEAFQDARKVAPAVRDWYHRDCFAIFGIADAASARANQGCVTLSRQYRFGPAINDLANAVAYGGTLQAADQERDTQGIVLVDVDGLGDEIAAVRRNLAGRGRWWPVGALIAKALANRQVTLAEKDGSNTAGQAGIVVPYKIQQELVQDVLTESGADPQIEVGTSHRFQGREFGTVIFDLVEDGIEPGWMASGRLDGRPWELGGLRAFNVAITRAQHRLYLIGNAAAIRKATKGPLAAVRSLLEADRLHVVQASHVLGLPDAPSDDPDASEVWHALRDHVTLMDLFDEDRLPAELCRRMDQASERIWLWSPWVGRRSEQLLPHLTSAQDRGVRVHVVVLPPGQVTEQLRIRHRELADQLPGTIFFWKEHQKIIVIDRSLTFIGSMNVLAHPERGRHEVMALFEGSKLAEAILRHERADELARPPTCPSCGTTVMFVSIDGGTRKNTGQRRLHWICLTKSADDQRCGWKRPFTDRPGTRNQPGRR